MYYRAISSHQQLRTIVLLLVALGLQANPARAQEKGRSAEPRSQPAELNRHGAEAMGFEQQKVTHHFRLLPDGGLIRVDANDEKDTDTVARIRKHLKEQATKFSKGDFSAPVHTHGEVPSGVPAMVKLSQKIQYQYKPRPRGGELRISSSDPSAVAAVHEFLKYQQAQHHGRFDRGALNFQAALGSTGAYSAAPVSREVLNWKSK